MSKRRELIVRLEKPSLKREQEFLASVRASRKFLQGWAAPPTTGRAFRAYVAHLCTPTHQGHFVVLRSSGVLVGVINLTESKPALRRRSNVLVTALTSAWRS